MRVRCNVFPASSVRTRSRRRCASSDPSSPAGPAATAPRSRSTSRELEALGVKRPRDYADLLPRRRQPPDDLPSTSRCSATRSSGEVEFVLLQHAGRLWVGVGSDHTDREVETYGVTVSKQMCDKPIAPQFWAFDEVAAALGPADAALVRSIGDGERLLYQEGAGRRHAGAARVDPRVTRGSDALPDGTLDVLRHARRQGRRAAAERFDVRARGPGAASARSSITIEPCRCRSPGRAGRKEICACP